MNRKLWIGIVSCIMAMGIHAENIRVMRFVPVAGAESEVAENFVEAYLYVTVSVRGLREK